MDFNIRKYLKVLEDHLPFEKQDVVYHKTDADYGAGVVISYRIWETGGDIEFLVSFSPQQNVWCYAETLSKTKPIDY